MFQKTCNGRRLLALARSVTMLVAEVMRKQTSVDRGSFSNLSWSQHLPERVLQK